MNGGRTIQTKGGVVEILDQTLLPFETTFRRIETAEQMAEAIRVMRVRGAPLIGVAGAFGVALALKSDASDANLARACELLGATRPTAVNLRRRIDELRRELTTVRPAERFTRAYARAQAISDEEATLSRRIGEHGAELIRAAHRRTGRAVNVLTHCNAGWLATVDWGTALAPIYVAHGEGVPVHVWVDETRPRNQGYLTAYELSQERVPHTVIADNTGGHLMQHGRVDLCIVGTDRTTAAGDVCNKVGTYLKALAAHDNGVPFYVAAPESSIDWSISHGREIPIEERGAEELERIRGLDASGQVLEVRLPASAFANFAFDVTPARLVTGLITERGLCPASREGLRSLFPEHAR
jgi:methylthioribose-1-phosphate isomerase